MNQRNMDALANLADGYLEQANCGMDCCCDAMKMAEFLASRGVLVPAALTDEECTGLPFGDACPGQPMEEVPVFVRETLERIARGEHE